MVGRFASAVLWLLWAPLWLVAIALPAHAAVLPPEQTNRPLELYERVLAVKAPGLVAPPADYVQEAVATSCDPRRAPRTHAVLVGATDIGLGQKFVLEGVVNDVELLAGLMLDRGVPPERVHKLVGRDATRANIFRAFHSVLAASGCDDRIIIHFSGHSTQVVGVAKHALMLGRDVLTEAEWELAFGGSKLERYVTGYADEPATDTLSASSARAAMLFHLAVREDLALLLNDDREDFHEVMRGSEVSDFMVAVRNTGAHAIAILDAQHAGSALIEQRQRAADPANWSFRYSTRPAQDRLPRATLVRGHGSFTVFYAAEASQVTPEIRLPRGDPGARKFGLFTHVLGSTLLENPLATPRMIGEAIQQRYAAEGRLRPHPRIESSSPDLVFVAEAQPPRIDPITIISPAPQRGAVPIERPEIEIEGLVAWSAPVLGVFLGEADATVDPTGRFRGKVTLKPGLNAINIRAITADNRMHTRRLELLYEGDRQALAGEGRRFAVIIANQNYGGATGMPSLSTPFADADALAAVLSSRYGFLTEIDAGARKVPLILKDPTKRDIEVALHQLGKVAGAKDTVLIFYAGHGVFEPVTSTAYWVPADAEQGFEPSYLSAADISAAIQRIQAGHVILISDSCYSGALLRGGAAGDGRIDDAQRMQALLKLQARKSRIVITSGNNEPVADGGGGGHSVFARALLTGLENVEHDAFSARELFDGYILQQVAANADQEPQYRPLEKVGHEGGDFVFVKRTAP